MAHAGTELLVHSSALRTASTICNCPDFCFRDLMALSVTAHKWELLEETEQCETQCDFKEMRAWCFP